MPSGYFGCVVPGTARISGGRRYLRRVLLVPAFRRATLLAAVRGFARLAAGFFLAPVLLDRLAFVAVPALLFAILLSPLYRV